ncbi:TPA: glycosyltransferase family 2 protein [Proteus mirabilis]|nr:glycosyltransferase [Proteus mirabilis]
MEKFSIIIPMYNVEKYIHQCIQSILSQTYQNFEVIVIDDGSSDNSSKIVDEIIKSEKRVTLIKNKNNGPSISRNIGIEKSTGDIILFLDSDDMYVPNTLQTCLDEINKNRLDILYFNSRGFCDEFNEIQNKQALDFIGDRKRHINIINKVLTGKQYYSLMFKYNNFYSSICYCAFRSSIIKNQRFVDNVIHEDELFTAEILLKQNTKRVLCIPDILYLRRIRQNSIMTTAIQEKNITSYRIIIEKLLLLNVKNTYLETHINKLAFNKAYYRLKLKNKITLNERLDNMKWVYNLNVAKKKNKIILYMLSLFPEITNTYQKMKKIIK